jgi:AraC family transcriptional regulator of adaptative response / DNA-3-methyladenine glycosylase II
MRQNDSGDAAPSGHGRTELDSNACYRALETRDARFDGRFFVAVRSTGVYCRPVCSARTPRRENCLFVPCAAAAAEAGFRPCLRCRPEAAPGTPAWQGTSATVSRAMRLINDGALDDGSVEELSAKLGVGERHLRRLFIEHLGASPVAVAQSRRLLFAKKLIDETRLPMSEIAFASGFASIRRFNDAVRKTWDRAPRELRKTRRASENEDAGREATPTLVLRLPFRPPLDWDALVGFLSLRAIPGVEVASARRYARSIELGSASGIVEVEPLAEQNQLVARLYLSGTAPIIRVSDRLRRIFDLSADPDRIAQQLRGDRALRGRLRAHPGLRVPGAWDGFELAVRAILGQQVSVRGATTLAGRLARAYGRKLPELATGRDRELPDLLFPTPEALVDVDPSRIGLTRARGLAISALAEAVASGELELDVSANPEETMARLRALPGVGEWTAQYIAMRALAEPDAFPASDLVLRKVLAQEDTNDKLSEKQVYARAEAWRPWRAYAALHLWTTPEAPAGRRTAARAQNGKSTKTPRTGNGTAPSRKTRRTR